MEPSPLERYRALQDKVDAFFARVEARHGAEMQCRTGCHDCCRVELTLGALEADALAAGLDALPGPERAAVTAAAASGEPDRCAALDAGGRCRIYALRPLVCRSHGLPIRIAPPDRRALPVVDACPRNFRDGEVEGDCVLDQETLSTVHAALEAAHAREGSAPRGRVGLRSVLIGGR